MGRDRKEADGELSVLLVVTVVIGLTLMASLIMCYACVLRRLCCGTPRERKAAALSKRKSEDVPMNDLTLISRSSQPTDTERI